MSRELWYCPNCLQASTRHWNLEIHIKRKHSGTGQPIRKSGLATQFVARMNFADNSYCGATNQRVYTTPFYSVRKEAFDNNPFAVCDKVQEFADKLVKLKTLLSKYLPQQELKQIEVVCLKAFGSGDTGLLDQFLKEGRRWVRFRDTIGKIGFPETNQLMSKIVSERSSVRPSSSAFHYTISNSNKKYYSSPNVRVDMTQTRNIDPSSTTINSRVRSSSPRASPMPRTRSTRSQPQPLTASFSFYDTTPVPPPQYIKHSTPLHSSPNQAFIDWIRSDFL
jgi:hypothetical protein